MGKYETTLSGAAITSTLNQMSMIGDIGKEILKKFGIKKINLNKNIPLKSEVQFILKPEKDLVKKRCIFMD